MVLLLMELARLIAPFIETLVPVLACLAYLAESLDGLRSPCTARLNLLNSLLAAASAKRN